MFLIVSLIKSAQNKSKKKFKISDNSGPGVTSSNIKDKHLELFPLAITLKKMIETGPKVIKKLRA